jgi:hypothetical protein
LDRGTDDQAVATANWLWQAAMRAGDAEAAAAALAAVSEPAPVLVEDASYLNLTRVYRGEASASTLLAAARGDGALDFSTVAYGLGVWMLVVERQEAQAGRS